MALNLEQMIDMFPAMERYREAYLPVTPIPRPLPGFPAMAGSNKPTNATGDWITSMRASFGNIRKQTVFSVGNVTQYLVTDHPEILNGDHTKEGFDVYIVRGDLGDLKERALFQASYARAVVNACVLASPLPPQWTNPDDSGPSDDLLEYLERPLFVDPFTPIHMQLSEGNNVPVLADRQSDVDVSKPKMLSPASSMALLLYQAAVKIVGPETDPIDQYTAMHLAMPAEMRGDYQDLIALLRDDQFDGFQTAVEIRDIKPSDALYPLFHLNDALYI